MSEIENMKNECMNECVILTANVRSLKDKRNEIEMLAILHCADLLVFCKTWANEKRADSEYFIKGYDVALREDKRSPTGVGGGVIVYCKNEDVARFQEDIDRIADWADSFGIQMNITKCCYIVFGKFAERSNFTWGE